MTSIGFIGFGEAASAMAKDLRDGGAEHVFAYDRLLDDDASRQLVVERMDGAGVQHCPTLAKLLQSTEVVLSLVVASAAVDVAEACGNDLGPQHLYVDMNSTSPATKQRVHATVDPTGARFAEVAIMGAVPPTGIRTPMLVGGPAAEQLARLLAPFGTRMDVVGIEVGQASATKMVRSAVVKGLEALLDEATEAAATFGVERAVLESIERSFGDKDWVELARYLAGRTKAHGARRAAELREVARALSDLGVEPVMASAAAERLSRAAGRADEDA